MTYLEQPPFEFFIRTKLNIKNSIALLNGITRASLSTFKNRLGEQRPREQSTYC